VLGVRRSVVWVQVCGVDCAGWVLGMAVVDDGRGIDNSDVV
jgi:hypothetical protein